ncbi:MAG: hypothetical protein KF772_04420 [Cryobacterium sp.]|nr:hypothetical protein [Cryobacterium sp.]MCO5295080.1 hypothetical protein [Homoserinimonas sp.]
MLERPVGDDEFDWVVAEEALVQRGIGFLSGSGRLRLRGGTVRLARIGEVNTTRVVLIADQ